MKKALSKSCGCYRQRHNRWVEPSILFLLWHEPKHGYELMAEIPKLGFMSSPADPGAVYRTLRHMEVNGFVESEWDTSGSGPAKRRYSLTNRGRQHLDLWRDVLAERKNALTRFLGEINQLEGMTDENRSN